MNKVWKNILSLGLGFGLMTSLTFSFSTVDQSQLLKENDRQVAVFELQRALNELGYFKSTEFTNLYGKQTIEAVKAFQRSQEMTADGVSGKTTLKAIRDHQLSTRRLETLEEGSTNSRVHLLKLDLKELGYYTGATEGSQMDAALVKALKTFQTKAGLKSDGKAGDGTLEAITKAIAQKRNYVANTQTAAAKPAATAAKPAATAAQSAATTAKPAATAANTAAQAATTTPAKTTVVSAAKTAAAPAAQTTVKAAAAQKTSTAVSRGAEAVRKSKDFLGIAYVWGGSSAKGFDCSGYTLYIMKQFGVKLPHGATAQYQYGTAVSKADLKEGDLLFFKTGDAPIGHVGIYIGNGQFIHASSAKNKVIISSLKTYGGKYVGARRVL